MSIVLQRSIFYCFLCLLWRWICRSFQQSSGAVSTEEKQKLLVEISTAALIKKDFLLFLLKRKISVVEIFYCSIYYRGEVEIVSMIFYCSVYYRGEVSIERQMYSRNFLQIFLVEIFYRSVYYRGDRRGDGARGRGYNTLLHLGVIHINSIFSLYLLCICSVFSLYLFYRLSTFSLHFLYICFIFLLHIFSLYLLYISPPLSLYFPYIFISTLF